MLYRTGDLGRRREDGALLFVGRRDNQVKIHGNRVDLGDVERAVASNSIIDDATVVAVDDPGRPDDLKLVAFVLVSSEVESLDAVVAMLRSSSRRLLPGYMVPAEFRIVRSFPLTSNGKVDRQALRGLVEMGDTSPDISRSEHEAQSLQTPSPVSSRSAVSP